MLRRKSGRIRPTWRRFVEKSKQSGTTAAAALNLTRRRRGVRFQAPVDNRGGPVDTRDLRFRGPVDNVEVRSIREVSDSEVRSISPWVRSIRGISDSEVRSISGVSNSQLRSIPTVGGHGSSSERRPAAGIAAAGRETRRSRYPWRDPNRERLHDARSEPDVGLTFRGRSAISAGFALPRDAGRRPALRGERRHCGGRTGQTVFTQELAGVPGRRGRELLAAGRRAVLPGACRPPTGTIGWASAFPAVRVADGRGGSGAGWIPGVRRGDEARLDQRFHEDCQEFRV